MERSQNDLTRGQKRALLHIRRGKDVFLTGGAGTGKSTVLRIAIEEFLTQGKSVLVCAPTGVSALSIDGITLHRAFGFPADVCITSGGDKTSRPMSVMTRTPAVVRGADVIIIDEISMVRMDLFDSVIASLKKIESKSGKKTQIVVSGDFFQLPPVLKKGSFEKRTLNKFYKKDVKAGYAFEGMYWDKCKFYPVVLTEVVRQNDETFTSILNLARTGDTDCLDFLNRNCITNAGTDENKFVHLYSYIKNVERQNLLAMNDLPGELYEFKTIITPCGDYQFEDIDPSILSGISGSVWLKEGARVIITANDNFLKGAEIISHHGIHRTYDQPLYYNGSTGTVYAVNPFSEQDTKTRPVAVQLDSGNLIYLYPVEYPIYSYVYDQVTNLTKRIQVASYTQLPLQPAYSITIHRAQGQTYDNIILDPAAFAPGQLYVGLTRTKTLSGLHLTREIKPENLIVDPAVLQFYNTLGEGKMGRPIKNADGSKRTHLVWVPAPLERHIRTEIEKGHPLKMTYMPKWKSGRVHMRVSEEMYEHITNEIATWKKMAKR